MTASRHCVPGGGCARFAIRWNGLETGVVEVLRAVGAPLRASGEGPSQGALRTAAGPQSAGSGHLNVEVPRNKH